MAWYWWILIIYVYTFFLIKYANKIDKKYTVLDKNLWWVNWFALGLAPIMAPIITVFTFGDKFPKFGDFLCWLIFDREFKTLKKFTCWLFNY